MISIGYFDRLAEMSVKLLKMYDENMIQNVSSLIKINNKDCLSGTRRLLVVLIF